MKSIRVWSNNGDLVQEIVVDSVYFSAESYDKQRAYAPNQCAAIVNMANCYIVLIKEEDNDTCINKS